MFSCEKKDMFCVVCGEYITLVRDLSLFKESLELLASRLKEKGCLAPKTKFTFYRDRDVSFRKFFY